jgi:NADP-dependent 3-hydroxy acid dehydrogenase YdfG
MSFDRKTVAITGAAGNLGRAVARAFADSGAKLVLLDVRRESLDAAYPGDDPAQLKLAVDLLDAPAVSAAMTDAAAQTGAIDVLCAIAGGFHMGEPVHQIPADKWRLMLDMNAGTLLNSVQAVVPAMLERKQGKIITIGANAAHKGMAIWERTVPAKAP